jgi:hypothetical protein
MTVEFDIANVEDNHLLYELHNVEPTEKELRHYKRLTDGQFLVLNDKASLLVNRLVAVKINEIRSDNAFEVYKRIRMLDIACNSSVELWKSTEDVASFIGLKIDHHLNVHETFEELIFSLIETRAISSI